MILRWRKKTVVHSRAGAAHGRYGHSKQQHDNCINKSSLTTQQRDGLDPSRCVAIWDNGCFHRTALVLFNWFIDAQSATIMSIFLISTEDGMWNAMKMIFFFFLNLPLDFCLKIYWTCMYIQYLFTYMYVWMLWTISYSLHFIHKTVVFYIHHIHVIHICRFYYGYSWLTNLFVIKTLFSWKTNQQINSNLS